MNKQWNYLDKFIQKMRFAAIVKEVKNGTVICDMGCGVDGKLLEFLKKKIQKGYGFDRRISDSFNENIVLKNLDNIEDGVPLETQSMDHVTALAVLEHLYNPIKFLNECFRILKNDGKLLLTVPTPHAKPILEFLAFTLHIISEDEIRDHKHYYTKSELEKIFRQVGFSKIQIVTFEFGLNYKCIVQK